MKPILEIKPGFYISICLAILLLPIKWLLAWIIAAALHELGHYIALRLSGNVVDTITLGANGAVMITEELYRGRGVMCALSGPLAGIALLLLLRVTPRLALCGLVQSLYNLLPVYPLDGGRAVRCLLRGKKGCDVIEYVTLITLLVIALYAMICLDLGIVPIIAVFVLFVKNGKIKIPCKQRAEGVQ